MKYLLHVLMLLTLVTQGFTQSSNTRTEKEVLVLLTTSKGDIKLALYNQTPKHRENFVKLVNEGFYDGLLFHRVMENFMIQGGDPESKNAQPAQRLGTGGPGYTVEAEFVDTLYHFKGALAAARQPDQVNPNRESSGSQFYIVQGNKFSPDQLNGFEEQINKQRKNQILSLLLQNPENDKLKRMLEGYVKVGNQNELNFMLQRLEPTLEQELEKQGKFAYSEEAKKTYQELGGAPHLDGGYTVFGYVVEGLDVVDKIAAVATDGSNRPNEDVKIIKAKVVKK